jgi:hypothetical protein
MVEEQRIPIRSPQWRALHARIRVAMELTSRLNAVPFGDVETRNAMLASGPSSTSRRPWGTAARSSTWAASRSEPGR